MGNLSFLELAIALICIAVIIAFIIRVIKSFFKRN